MPDATADLSDLALEGDAASEAAPASAPSADKKLVLLDGNSLLYRGFFAMRALTPSAGQPTNPVFSFTMMLLTRLQEQKPDVMVGAGAAEEKKTSGQEEKRE